MGFDFMRGLASAAEGGAGLIKEQYNRQQDLNEWKYKQEIVSRMEEARMVRQIALQRLGKSSPYAGKVYWDEEGNAIQADEYWSMPEGERPKISNNPPKSAKEEKDPFAGKVYWDEEGNAIRADEYWSMPEGERPKVRNTPPKDAKEEKDPFAGKTYWDEEGNAIRADEYWNMPANERPKVRNTPPKEASEKLAMTEKEARKEILRIDEKIAKLRSGGSVSAGELSSLAEKNPVFALFANQKELRPEDRDKLIEKLEEHRDWAYQFIPSSKGLLRSGAVVSEDEEEDDVSSFIQQALRR